jgi:predicted CXXCH cytochrome family protein
MVHSRRPGISGIGPSLRRRGPLLLALALSLPLVRLGAPVAVADAPMIPVKLALPSDNTQERITSAQCAACHSTVPELSHPVNVTPSMTLPAGWPLDNGRVGCTTCHLDSFLDHAAGNGSLLRGGGLSGPAFCAQCHIRSSLSRQNQHPFAISQAHLLPPAGVTPAPAGAASTADSDSINSCLSCHDGAVAPDAYGGLAMGASPGAAGHPVGIAYPSARLRLRDASFNAPDRLDPRVRLTAGQVTCNACHSLYSPVPRLLVMRNDRSALCLTCHAQ